MRRAYRLPEWFNDLKEETVRKDWENRAHRRGGTSTDRLNLIPTASVALGLYKHYLSPHEQAEVIQELERLNIVTPMGSRDYKTILFNTLQPAADIDSEFLPMVIPPQSEDKIFPIKDLGKALNIAAHLKLDDSILNGHPPSALLSDLGQLALSSGQAPVILKNFDTYFSNVQHTGLKQDIKDYLNRDEMSL